MAITSLEAIPISIYEKTERELAYGKISFRENVIVRIECENGAAGIAETAPIPIRWGCEETQQSVVSAIRDHIAPLIMGEDPTRIAFLLDRIAQRVGDLPYARGAVGDALYDLSARLAGIPIARMLGGIRADSLKASHSISFKSPDAAAAEAAEAVASGFDWIKVKIGSRDPQTDINRVAAVRQAIGPNTPIHVDANAGYSYLDALDILPKMEKFHLRLIEQPVAGWDLRNLGTLRRKLKTPIMADESVRSYRDLQEVIRHDAADAVLMKLAKHGGIREAQKIADLAQSAGLALYPSTHMVTSVGVATSVQFYATVGGLTPGDFHAGPSFLEHDLVADPILPVNGSVAVPHRPGNGIAVVDALLARSRKAEDATPPGSRGRA